MRNITIRALRTFAQTTLGVYLAGIVATGTTLSGLANISLLDSAIAAGIVSLLAFAQNLLETTSDVNYNRG